MLAPLFEKYAGQIPVCREQELVLYEKHFAMLCSWNERMNLVSRKSIDKAFAAHYVDSLYITDFAGRFAELRSIFDVGSGAGFPGVIAAIRFPDRKVQLLEKSLKKQTFLTAVMSQLSLPHLSMAERLSGSPTAGLFLARAVFPPVELFSYMETHLAPGSILIANFGGQSESISPPADFTLLDQARYSLPLDCGERRVEAYRFR